MDLTLPGCNIKLMFRFVISFAMGLCIGYPISWHIKSQLSKPACTKSHWYFPSWRLDIRSHGESELSSEQQTVYIGMMSMKSRLDTRVEAAINTWAKHPNIKVEIFSNNNGSRDEAGRFVESYLRNGIRVIQLAGVTDVAYPPQKKSFAMVKFMHDMYLNNYDWFIRLDDDAYVDMDKLRVVLSKINSSVPLYLGNVGKGKDENDYVQAGENYCMGGPGMIFSKGLLHELGPKLKHCLRHLMTEHEDIELGRCITAATERRCSWSWEFARKFVQKYDNGVMVRNIKQVSRAELDEGVIFHCNKDSEYQYNLHVLMLKQKIAELMAKVTRLEREIQTDFKPGETWLSMPTNSSKMHWNAMVASHSYKTNEREACLDKHVTLSKTLQDTMEKFVQYLYFEPYQGNIHRFTIANSYYVLNPLLSFDIVSWVVGSHAIKESRLLHQRKSFMKNLNFFHEPHEINVDTAGRSRNPIINFVITFKGKNDNLKPFLENFERVCLGKQESVNLIITHFPSTTQSNDESSIAAEVKSVDVKVRDLQTKYPDAEIEFHAIKSGIKFARSVGQKIASKLVTNGDEIIFFSDIDLAFSPSILDRIRKNTIQGKQVYDPVFFTQYDPGVVYSRGSKPSSPFSFRELDGFWWYSRDGVLAIYKSDLQAILDHSNDVLEDDNLETVLSKSNLEVFQTADPSQVHIYHEKFCDPSTSAQHYRSCVYSRASQSGPRTFLYHLYKAADNAMVVEES